MSGVGLGPEIIEMRDTIRCIPDILNDSGAANTENLSICLFGILQFSYPFCIRLAWPIALAANHGNYREEGTECADTAHVHTRAGYDKGLC